LVGSYQIYNIPKRDGFETKLKVMYKYNQNQIVEASTVDLNTTKPLPMKKIIEDVDLNRLLIDRKVDVSLYSEFAGQTRIKGALRDKYGNAAGTQYDLGRDGAFGNYHVHIFCALSLNYMALPVLALKEKGFKVTLTQDIKKTMAEIKNQANVLWIISGDVGNAHWGPSFSKSEVHEIVKFHELGKGLYIWTDNDPLFAHANQILPDIVGARIVGNTPACKVLEEGDGRKIGTFQKHLVTTGIEKLFEGDSISYPDPLGKLIPLATSTDGHPVVSCYEGMRCGGRILVDCGFTKLYCNWDTAGTARYVKNATVWLLNLEKNGALRR
jgi:hypothetical protein